MKQITSIIFCIIFPITLFSQECDYEIIKQVSYRQASINNLTQTDTVILQINNRKGDYMSDINIHFDKNDNIKLGDAWIEGLSGNIIRKLKKSEIKKESAIDAGSFYEDAFVYSFNLRHNQYPYRIMYSYKRSTSKFINIAYLLLQYRNCPVRNMQLIIEAPIDYKIRYTQKNTPEPTIDTIGKNLSLKWSINYTPVKRQTNAPYAELKAPQVFVTPFDFKYGEKGSFDSWQSFGNWVYQLNKKSKELPDAEKTKIERMLSGVNNPREKIAILYNYLQRYTRYINVSIDIGGLKTYPAEHVAANKYGDCKGLSNYMQAMLEYAGIKAYYTLVSAGDEAREHQIDKNFPAQAFNHVILTVPFEQDTVFLECTSKNIPAGYLGMFTQNRAGLIIDSDNKSRLVQIPSLKINNVLSTHNITSSLQSGDANIHAKITSYGGDDYDHISALVSSVHRDIAKRYIQEELFPQAELKELSFDKPSGDSTKIELNVTLSMKNAYKQYGNNLLITPFAYKLPNYESPEKRTQAVQLDCPIYYHDTITYILPDKTQANAIPKNIAVKCDFGEYIVNYKLNNNQLAIEKTILINSGLYPLSVYKDFYTFISTIQSSEKKNIYIQTL